MVKAGTKEELLQEVASRKESPATSNVAGTTNNSATSSQVKLEDIQRGENIDIDKTKISGKWNKQEKRTKKSESFSDWLASVVERKRAEIRDLKPSKENAGYKAAKKREEEV